MSCRRFCLVLIAVIASGAAMRAQGLGLPPLTDTFAICTGRLSAMMEYRWMRDDPATGEAARQLGTMRGLLDTVATPEINGLVLSRENEAKLAFERLLGRSEDEAGGWALARAEAELAECTDLILD